MRMETVLFVVLFGSSHLGLAENLAVTYQDALANDVQYTAAKAQFVATQARVPQSLAALLPSVSLNANTMWNNNRSNFATSDGQYNSNGYTINLTQAIFRRQNNITLDQAGQAVEQAKAQLELARQDLIVRVSQAYFDVLLVQNNLETLRAQRAATGEQAASAKRKFEIGTASITDLRDTQARFNVVKAQEIAAQNDVNAKRQALRVLTNKEPGHLAGLRSGVVISPPSPDNMEAWVKSAETASMAVVAGQAALDIARLEEGKARAAHFPTLDLTAAVGHSRSATTSSVGTDLTARTIGLQLAVPIYSGGATVGRQHEVAALLEKAQAELDGARRNGALATRQAYFGVNSGLALIVALEDALDSARTALDANKRGLEVGVRVDIDVLNAQQQYWVTQRDLFKSRYDTLMALLRLKGASGSLGDGDVQEVNALLTVD